MTQRLDPEQGPQLGIQQGRLGLPQTHAAHAQRRVGDGGQGEVRQLLVGTDIQRTDDHRPGPQRVDTGLVLLTLGVLVWRCVTPQKQELGTHQADAVGATVAGLAGFLGAADIGRHLDHAVVPGDHLQVSLGAFFLGARLAGGDVRHHLIAARLVGLEFQPAVVGIQHHRPIQTRLGCFQ